MLKNDGLYVKTGRRLDKILDKSKATRCVLLLSFDYCFAAVLRPFFAAVFKTDLPLY